MSTLAVSVVNNNETIPTITTTDDHVPIATLVTSTIPSSSPTNHPVVEIEAPSDLPEGYRLPVKIDHHDYLVVVPSGGVRSGQVFQVDKLLEMSPTYVASPILPANYNVMTTRTASSADNIPIGYWRNGLCDWYYHCGKPIFWCSFFCEPIALGQIMTRLDVTIWGEKKQNSDSAGDTSSSWTPFSFLRMFLILTYVANLIMNNILQIPGGFLFVPLYIYTLVMMIKIRIMIRNSYSIPGSCLSDCCLSFWCSCCTLIQMSGQITDLHTNETSCCTPTGLRNYNKRNDDDNDDGNNNNNNNNHHNHIEVTPNNIV